MATATLALTSPSEGNAWSVSITGVSFDTAAQVNTDSNYNGASIVCNTPNLGSLFSMPSTTNANSFALFPGKYATWRSSAAVTGLTPDGILQYPTQGFSLDIWSDILHDRIEANNSWVALSQYNSGSGAGIYILNPNKYSLIYDYPSRYAPLYSKGGNLSITVS